MTIFYFIFINTTVINYNKKEKTQQNGLGNLKLKLRTKVRGGNASEDAGPLARGTDATKSVWRPISPENGDVLICINAQFMTQRVLKSWWSWTYQNSAVKRASARAILGWMTTWEVWFGEPKADNIVSFEVGRYSRGHHWRWFQRCIESQWPKHQNNRGKQGERETKHKPKKT